MIAKLEMLIALAKEQHFGHAAEALGITQPSLSNGIRQLEDQLGVKLVNRGSRFGGLTPEGQRALVWARQIVGDARRLKQEMRATYAGLAGHVRLAVIPTALTWAAELTARFTERHPSTSFTVLSRSSEEILKQIENLDADAGLTYLDNEPLGRMTTTPLYREHYALLCRSDHVLAHKHSLRWPELNGIAMCLLTPDMQNRRILNRHLMQAGIEVVASVESNSTIVLVSNVIAGRSVTVLPDHLARFLAAGHDLCVVPIEEDSAAPTVGLVALHREPYTPVVQALRKLVAEMARDQ
ncbi:LysR family transcriptional regulator [Mesobacterium sp. TK19101]|uniref:LysR family transcriptional regulator n=1 Tax=Mesobacterium hydrothermale TaxID=3111907 RepID=A0ABU6HH04_9RHOB|nr:LysR family transcriptional regulator [Mesobacterium sp. TK19101]MEC3861697.1 LysR family transcriptional regulator [Mesobacterium sp. TK19101]